MQHTVLDQGCIFFELAVHCVISAACPFLTPMLPDELSMTGTVCVFISVKCKLSEFWFSVKARTLTKDTASWVLHAATSACMH